MMAVERAGVALMTAQTEVALQVHDLTFNDGVFRCSCSALHLVNDIDDARAAQEIHEAQVTAEPERNGDEPQELATIRARKNAATRGPCEWVGSSLETRYEAVLEMSVSCSSYCYGGSPSAEISDADKAFLENAHVDVSVAVAGLDAVIELHKPQQRFSRGIARRVCAECSRGLPGQGSESVVLWPCRTSIALKTAMAAESKAVQEYDPYAA